MNLLNRNETCKCSHFSHECWDYQSSVSKYYNGSCDLPTHNNVRVRIVVSSKDRESVWLMRSFKGILESVGKYIDFKILYAADVDPNTKYGFRSKSGNNDDEILLDMMEMCLEYFYPKYERYYPVLECINSVSSIEKMNVKRFEICVLGHGLNFDAIENCSLSQLGRKLLENSMQFLSPFVPILLIDTTTYHIKGVTTTEDILSTLCQQVYGDNSWWIVAIICGIVVMMLITLYVVTKIKIFSWFNSINKLFYQFENNDQIANDALREWNEMDHSNEDLIQIEYSNNDEISISESSLESLNNDL